MEFSQGEIKFVKTFAYYGKKTFTSFGDILDPVRDILPC